MRRMGALRSQGTSVVKDANVPVELVTAQNARRFLKPAP
jgi:hypothetical protein